MLSNGAPRRFQSWLLSLELRRDGEAVDSGARPLDLADAILAAARLAQTPWTPLAPGAGGSGRGIRTRLRRLLGEVDAEPCVRSMRPRRLTACLMTLAATSGTAGYHFGEAVLRMIPGVRF